MKFNKIVIPVGIILSLTAGFAFGVSEELKTGLSVDYKLKTREEKAQERIDALDKEIYDEILFEQEESKKDNAILGQTGKNNTVTEQEEVIKDSNNTVDITTSDTQKKKTLREIHGEIRGIWISTAYAIDFPKTVYNVDKQKQEINTILDSIVERDLNTIYFQVRPFADAFYKSEINPWSRYLSGTFGKDPKWDPLKYTIYAAHQRGLEIHAWLNPFRVSEKKIDLDAFLKSLPENHIAKNEDLIIRNSSTNAKGQTITEAYLNPKKVEVKNHLLDTVSEIITNYPELDGIHMDDYFYPAYYPLPEGESPDGTEANSRRDAVTDIVYSIYDSIKSVNPNLTFSISPAAVTKNSDMGTEAGLQNYYDLYADIEKWIKDEKLDVVIPQIYFDKNHKLVNFTTVANYWNELVEGTNVDLVIGHFIADEKGKEVVLAELDEQIEDSRNLNNSIGSAFFGYSNLINVEDKLNSVYN